MKAKTAKNVLGTIGKVVAIGAFLTLPRLLKVEVTAGCNDQTVGYYDAVRTITASSMLDSTKRECIEAMRRGEESGYYRAVIEIVQGSMLGSSKISMIRSL